MRAKHRRRSAFAKRLSRVAVEFLRLMVVAAALGALIGIVVWRAFA